MQWAELQVVSTLLHTSHLAVVAIGTVIALLLATLLLRWRFSGGSVKRLLQIGRRRIPLFPSNKGDGDSFPDGFYTDPMLAGKCSQLMAATGEGGK